MAEGKVAKEERTMKRILMLINCIMLCIGVSGGPLVNRLYFIHGGNRLWLSSFLQSAGFPVMLIPLSISYFIRRRRSRTLANDDATKPKMFSMKTPLFFASAFIGVLNGVDSYLYSYGVARLPVSTSSMILATQLAFTAVFAFLIVKQKFTPYSINAIFLLILGVGVLALRSSGDRPAGESSKLYVMGFVLTIVAAVLYGLILPLVELVYKKIKQTITYSLVLEIQLVMCLFASLFCIVGMIINNDFKVMGREARQFGLGEADYYLVLVGSAVVWQLNFLGIIGVIFCASSLLSGILSALMVSVTEVLAVILYKESFQADKGVSLVLSLWGFASYFYGEYKQAKKMQKYISLSELPQNHGVPKP